MASTTVHSLRYDVIANTDGFTKGMKVKNKRLEEENAILREEIDRLKHDPTYLEEKARKEYGLLKKNEMLYKFDKKK